MSEAKDYPDNLLQDVLNLYGSDKNETTAYAVDSAAILDSMLTRLSERERSFVTMRYKERKTYREIAAKSNICVERARQLTLKAVHHLARDPLHKALTIGMLEMLNQTATKYYTQGEAAGYRKGYMQGETDAKKAVLGITDGQNAKDIPLHDLDFSVRTSHCLNRQHLVTVGDVLDYPISNLMGIRGFGTTCYKEIISRFGRLGVIDPADYAICNS